MDIRKYISSGVGYFTLITIAILAIPAGILWGAISVVWNLSDRIIRRLEK